MGHLPRKTRLPRLKLRAMGAGLDHKRCTMHSFRVVGAAVAKRIKKAGCATGNEKHWVEISRNGKEMLRRTFGTSSHGGSGEVAGEAGREFTQASIQAGGKSRAERGWFQPCHKSP